MGNSTSRDDVAIRTTGVSREFGDFVAVDGTDLEIGQGELFALLGPNGAGKTTTIQMPCCLLRPTAGTATIMGRDVLHEPLAVKQLIAVSAQETAVAPNLTGFGDIATDLAWVAGYTVAVLGLAVAAFRRRMLE